MAKMMPRMARKVYIANSAGWISTVLVTSGIPSASKVGK